MTRLLPRISRLYFTAPLVFTACVLSVAPTRAQGPAAPAPGGNASAATPSNLPPPVAGKTIKAQPSPVVDTIAAGQKPSASDAGTAAQKSEKPARRKRVARRHRREAPLDVERPALAGVLLEEPLAPQPERPRPIVPTPAYFVDGLVSAFTIAPPPLACHPDRFDPDLPNPRLYRQAPVVCNVDVE